MAYSRTLHKYTCKTIYISENGCKSNNASLKMQSVYIGQLLK